MYNAATPEEKVILYMRIASEQTSFLTQTVEVFNQYYYLKEGVPTIATVQQPTVLSKAEWDGLIDYLLVGDLLPLNSLKLIDQQKALYVGAKNKILVGKIFGTNPDDWEEYDVPQEELDLHTKQVMN
jgi:hypothetical protein